MVGRPTRLASFAGASGVQRGRRSAPALMASPTGPRRGSVLMAAVLAVLAVAATAAGADTASKPEFAPAPPPPEATTATIMPSFAPDRLGVKAAFTFTVRFGGGDQGVPSPVRHAVVHLPPGLTLNIPKLRSCSRAQLQAGGARGCSARSEIGAGRALADVHTGATIESETAAVTAWVGPPRNLYPTIEILGQGYSPLDERVVITATALPDKPPYGEKLEMSIPAIPTIPLEPNASTVSFSLTIGVSEQLRHNHNTVRLPSRCPAGGFPFAAEFGYEDGSTGSTSTTVPCPTERS